MHLQVPFCPWSDLIYLFYYILIPTLELFVVWATLALYVLFPDISTTFSQFYKCSNAFQITSICLIELNSMSYFKKKKKETAFPVC